MEPEHLHGLNSGRLQIERKTKRDIFVSVDKDIERDASSLLSFLSLTLPLLVHGTLDTLLPLRQNHHRSMNETTWLLPLIILLPCVVLGYYASEISTAAYLELFIMVIAVITPDHFLHYPVFWH